MTRDHAPRPEEDEREFAEEQARLFRITIAPLIWALHFAACYGVVAVTCAKGWELGTVRPGLLAFSAAALVGIALTGLVARRQWGPARHGDAGDRGGRAGVRHRFLGHAAFLLAVISAIGVIFVPLPLLMIGSCR